MRSAVRAFCFSMPQCGSSAPLQRGHHNILLTGSVLPVGLFDLGVQTGMLLIKYATFINASGKPARVA